LRPEAIWLPPDKEIKMEKNARSAERKVRVILGAALLLLGLWSPLSTDLRIVLCGMASIALFIAFVEI